MINREFKKEYSWTCKQSEKKITVREKMLELGCDKCGSHHTRTKKHYNKMKKNNLFVMDYCNSCWMSIQNNISDRKEKNRQAQLKRYADPAERARTSQASKGNNSGNKNAMKRPEIRSRVSETRSELMKCEEYRKKFSQPSIDAWARGAYNNAKSNRTHWHTYLHSSGIEYKVQGTWELAFVKWLDENNLKFDCHSGRIPYIDDIGVERSYYPDFYVYQWCAYVDPKADYWYRQQYRKFELLKEQHPDKDIRILNKQKLIELGVKI